MSGITARRRASSRRGGRRARSPRAGAGARRRDGGWRPRRRTTGAGDRPARANPSTPACSRRCRTSSSPAPSPRRRTCSPRSPRSSPRVRRRGRGLGRRGRGRFRLGEHGHPGAASRGVRRPRENRGTLLCFGGMRNQIPTTTTTKRSRLSNPSECLRRGAQASSISAAREGVARAHDRYFARDDGLDRRRAGGRSAVVRGRGRGRGVRARSRRVVRRAVQGAAGEKDPRGRSAEDPQQSLLDALGDYMVLCGGDPPEDVRPDPARRPSPPRAASRAPRRGHPRVVAPAPLPLPPRRAEGARFPPRRSPRSRLARARADARAPLPTPRSSAGMARGHEDACQRRHARNLRRGASPRGNLEPRDARPARDSRPPRPPSAARRSAKHLSDTAVRRRRRRRRRVLLLLLLLLLRGGRPRTTPPPIASRDRSHPLDHPPPRTTARSPSPSPSPSPLPPRRKKYYFNPEGVRFRSRAEAVRHYGLAPVAAPKGPSKSQPGHRSGADAAAFPRRPKPPRPEPYPKVSDRVPRAEAARRVAKAREKKTAPPEAPFHAAEGVKILSLGKVDARPGYHDANHVFPLGFKTEWVNSDKSAVFHSEIVDGVSGEGSAAGGGSAPPPRGRGRRFASRGRCSRRRSSRTHRRMPPGPAPSVRSRRLTRGETTTRARPFRSSWRRGRRSTRGRR